ncbi:MAG TPA: hypothetical protein VM184_09025 [Gaiellaceae bacterium]|nr:hypothetical protein [Gaiellaceae bacterium]
MRPAERALDALRRDRVLLGALALVQWLVVGGIALAAEHNGWMWFQGGDETHYYTTSWLLGQGLLPQTPIGYGWSLLTTPVSMLAGANVLDALPAIVVGQYLLLLPVGLVAVWAIGESCGGRPLAISAAALWATLPALSIPLFVERYHPIYVDAVLPQLLGLANLADFPSTIALLVAAALLLKGIDHRSDELVLLSALATGFAVGIKPANLVFLAAPLVLLALARRPVQLLVFGAGLVPALATLALWKERGLGEIPVLARPESILAGGGTLVAAVGGVSLDRYVDLDWGHLWLNLRQLQEVFWGMRVLEWFALAGVFAVGRRSIPKAAFLATWLGSYVVVKGSAGAATVQDGTFFRFVQPGLPAYVLLAAACVLLLPPVWRLVADPPDPAWPRRRLLAAAGAGIVLLAALPLVVVAVVSPVQEPRTGTYLRDNVFVPVNAFLVRATRDEGSVRLAWDSQAPGSTRGFYRILRSEPGEGFYTALLDVRDGLECSHGELPVSCRIYSDIIATTRATTYTDRPPPGRWTYRIALSANAADDVERGDVVLVSDGAVVRVP